MPSFRFFLCLVLCSLGCFGIASQAIAQIASVNYQATVKSEIISNGSTSVVPLGTLVRGTLQYDTSAIGTTIDAGNVRYDGALVSHEVEILGETFALMGTADVFVLNNSVGGVDGFFTANALFQDSPTLAGLPLKGLNVSFQDLSQTALNSTALPLDLDTNDFGIIRGTFLLEESAIGQSTNYFFDNDGVIPEPSTLSLVMLVSLFATRHRRRSSYS